MQYLLKFGYDGRKFTGYQRGNGSNSVESSILSVIEEYGIAGGFSSAARTDRGVSAAGNVLLMKSEMKVQDVIGILNSQLRNIVFHSYASVGNEFRVRFSRMKHYRYNDFSENVDPKKFADQMSKFEGTHDFSLYSRKDTRTPVRTIDCVEVKEKAGYLEVNVFGPNFVWNQIRSMVGFARYYASMVGEGPDPFETEDKKWPLAEPEPLILMDIDYKGVEFSPYIGNKTVRVWKKTVKDLRLHTSVLDSIIESIEPRQTEKNPDQVN